MFTSGTFTSATEMMDILHTFLTTSAGYIANRVPTISASYYYSNYQKTVNTFGKTNTIYLNIRGVTSAAFPNGYGEDRISSNFDNDARGLQYSIGTGYTTSGMFLNQPGVSKNNAVSNPTEYVYQPFRNIDIKKYFIISDGNSVFINIVRPNSNTFLRQANASIYWCATVDPSGAGSYNGGTLIAGVGVGSLYYDKTSTLLWEKKPTESTWSNRLFTTNLYSPNTIMRIDTTPTTSGTMYNNATEAAGTDTYKKKILTNIEHTNSDYDTSVSHSSTACSMGPLMSYSRTQETYQSGTYRSHCFDSVTGRYAPNSVKIYAHRGSDKYSYVGSPPNILLFPVNIFNKTLEEYQIIEYKGSQYMLISYYAIKI